MATKKPAVVKRRRRRSAGFGSVTAIIRPKWIAVGAGLEALGSALAGIIPGDSTGLTGKLKRAPLALGMVAAGYFLKSPDVASVGLGMVASVVVAK